MRIPPEHERATLHADARSLLECAASLEALAGELPAGRGPEWTGVLAGLADRCRTAAAEVETAAALFAVDALERPQGAAARATATAGTAAGAATATAAAAAATSAAVLGRVKRAARPLHTAQSLANARRPLEP